MVWQHVIRTVGDEQHDVGAIAPPARVPARVRTGVAGDVGAWVTQPADGNADGLFVATIGGARDGAFDLGALAPGRYLLRPFRRSMSFVGDWGVRGTALAEPVAIDVHADGRTTPDVVWPDGIR
jgi:hypothetical protein